MTNVQIYSDKYVTKENPNGSVVVDIDTPNGIADFGGDVEVANYKKEALINNKIREMAEAELIKEGKLS